MSAFFVLFAVLALAGALGVLFFRNAVYCGLSLLVTLVALAGIYVLLDAPFVAVAQVIVYAGAVVVLFLFGLMLLGGRGERLRPNWSMVVAGGVMAGMLLAEVWAVWRRMEGGKLAVGGVGGVEELGRALLVGYAVPFELVGVVLLAGVVGGVILSRRRPDAEEECDAD